MTLIFSISIYMFSLKRLTMHDFFVRFADQFNQTKTMSFCFNVLFSCLKWRKNINKRRNLDRNFNHAKNLSLDVTIAMHKCIGQSVSQSIAMKGFSKTRLSHLIKFDHGYSICNAKETDTYLEL